MFDPNHQSLEETRHGPQGKRTLTLLMCELHSESFPIQPCVAVSNFDRVLGHWMHQQPLMSLTSSTWGLHPHPLPISWGIHLSSGLSLQPCFKLYCWRCICLQSLFLSPGWTLLYCHCSVFSPASCCSTWLEFQDRSPPKWRRSSAFSSLGLLMDLNTRSQVCPPCSDPTGLCPVGEGSLSHPCLGFEASLGWLGPVPAAPKEF